MVVVYSKSNCMQCNFTKQFLIDNEIEFVVKDIEEDVVALEEVKSLGFRHYQLLSLTDKSLLMVLDQIV